MDLYRCGADEATLAALGLVTANFAAIENAMEMAISLMLMPPRRDTDTDLSFAARATIVTAEMSFRQLIFAFASLYREVFPSEVDSAFERLCSKLHQSEGRRNQLTHSFYAKSADGSAVIRRKTTAKDGLNWQTEEVTATSIREFVESLPALAQATHHIVLTKLLTPELRAALLGESIGEVALGSGDE